jgi:hypothetical protein
VADPQTTIISASALGGAESVVTNPGTPTTTIVSAAAGSGAGVASGSVHFNPPIGIVLAGPDMVDGVTGAYLSTEQRLSRSGQSGVRSLGIPHFAFATPVANLSYGGGPYYNAYVMFSLERLPTAVSSEDEVHWLLSLHEASGQARELISIGVTPAGSLAFATRDSGVRLSAKGAAPTDGSYHLARVELDAGSGLRTLYLDGIGIVIDSINRAASEQAVPAVGVPVRVALFNGRDGLSCLRASISSAGIGLGSFVAPDEPVADERAVSWLVKEGYGGSLECSADSPAEMATTFGPATLVAMWFDGSPLSNSPDDPSKSLTSAYSWGFNTAWTVRPPHRITYRKAVSL